MSEAISRYLNKEIDYRVANQLADKKPDQPAKHIHQIRAASYTDVLGEANADGTIWRRLTTNPSRDLIPILQDRMVEIAYWLNETNPLAGWLIDITTAFIMGEELPFTADNTDVKAVLDGFWNDPINRMPLYFPKHVSELHIFGELCFPAFTAKQTGRVRLGYIDPAQIKDVITDPENVKVPIGVTTKGWIGEVAGYSVNTEAKSYRVILPEDADYVLSDQAKQIRAQLTNGDCFYWSINNVSNSPRGRSSLLPVADWLDAYEQFLFDYADRWPMLNTFIWDLLVEGGDENDIKQQVQAFTKKSGSVYGHNEKTKLEASTPDLKTFEASEGARLIRNHIMGRWGYPEHWYGGGGDVNLATAKEMSGPALKMLSQKQLAVKYILQDMLTYQAHQARNARYLKVSDEDAGKISVVTPKMDTGDVSKLGSMVQQIATALIGAETQGWVDKDTARKIFAAIVNFTGVDIDLDQVKNAIGEEKNSKGYEDVSRLWRVGHDQNDPLSRLSTER
ncbi:MAG: hypothetical protein PHN75_14525 [Syntrophales bacterium]|nr:hypothetical protein [Syntrophales bacterium]